MQPSLWIVGGGGAAELSLLLFCEAQARLPPHSAQPPHPLLPPTASKPLSASGSCTNDAAAAFRVLAAGLSLLLRTLLENSLPSDAASGVAGSLGHAASLPWIKIVPQLVSLLRLRRRGAAVTFGGVLQVDKERCALTLSVFALFWPSLCSFCRSSFDML